MKPSLMFGLLVLSIFLYEAQGIRLEKTISASNHQKLVTKTSSSNEDDGSAMATELSSGINRKLMTKIIPSSSTTTNDKNYEKDPKTGLKFTHELVGKEETFPDVIDITGMDYSPAKRKPPIHN